MELKEHLKEHRNRLGLSQEDREIFMMHWFLNMVDREIAEYMNMARRTVNTRRQKAYRLLKELMGGDVDG